MQPRPANIDNISAASGLGTEDDFCLMSEEATDAGDQSRQPASQMPRRTIQDALPGEAMLAVKLSVKCASLDELRRQLVAHLGQNSIETRSRYAQSIVQWFFSDGLDGLLRETWNTYGDEAIIKDLLRYMYLAKEPVMGACVAEALYPLEPGITIPTSYFDQFLGQFMKDVVPEKTRERLKGNLKKLGFLERVKSKPDRLLPVVPQRTSLLLLLHHLFAAKAARTVELQHLLANPFWKHLGCKSEDAVRAVLREANATGLIGKYIVADQLEQVTTCFTLDELLDRRVRL